MLPLILLGFARMGVASTLALVAGSSLIFRYYVLATPYAYLVDGFFLGRWAEFALGVALGRLMTNRAIKVGGSWTLAGIAIVAAALCAAPPLVGDLVIGLGFAAVIGGLVTLEAKGLSLLSWLAPVGTISYSLYLIHGFVTECGIQVWVKVFHRPIPLWASLGLFAASLAAGCVFWWLVESRVPSWRARFDRRFFGPRTVTSLAVMPPEGAIGVPTAR